MAADSLLLKQAENGAPPALRLYGWSRPCVSIGYAQDIGDVDIENAGAVGADIVRRPTGGRAVLHHDELTYAVAIPSSSTLFGPLGDVYELAARAIRLAIESFGISVDSPAHHSAPGRNPCCFASRTRSEISVNGRKVVGSAQRRVKNAALQHGSIILSMDVTAYLSCLSWKNDAAKMKTAAGIGGLNDGREISIASDELAGEVVRAFEKLHRISFDKRPFSPQELSEIELSGEAFAAPDGVTGARSL